MAPDQVKAAVTALGSEWLTVQDTKWQTEDTALKEGKTYYLTAAVAAEGHSLPDGFRITVNGQEPMNRTIEYKDGRVVVTGIWTFTIGTPDKVIISFDNNSHGTAPQNVTLDAGTMLKYADLDITDQGIVKEENASWRFVGWFDENGSEWNTVTADQDIVLKAKWTRLIDDIALTYELPGIGDSGDSLLKVSIPEGVPYRIRNSKLRDTDRYDPVNVIENNNVLELVVEIVPVSEEFDFLLENNEWDYPEFAGKLTLNGTEDATHFYEMATDEEDAYLVVYYNFSPEEGGFVDVPDNVWYTAPVDWAVKNGITEGVDPRHFAPDMTCTRAQMVTFLWRAFGKPEVSDTDCAFVDVENDQYYTDAVLWAIDQGITNGTDEIHFSPDENVTRGQCVTFLCRLMGSQIDEPVSFTDVNKDAYYYESVCWAVAYGITNGKSETVFDPDGDCKRSEIVTFLYRAKGREENA